MARKTILALTALLAVGLIGMAPIRAQAQDDPGHTNIPSLEFNSADVRDVLRALFKNVGVSYSIEPDVQGTVSVSLKNVPFETALQNVLKQVKATYRVEGGIYQIIKRENPPLRDPVPNNVAPNAPTHVVRRLKIRAADPHFVMLMLAGSQSTSTWPEMSTVFNTPPVGGGRNGGGGFGNGFGGGNQNGNGNGNGNNNGSNNGFRGPGGSNGGNHGFGG